MSAPLAAALAMTFVAAFATTLAAMRLTLSPSLPLHLGLSLHRRLTLMHHRLRLSAARTATALSAALRVALMHALILH